MLIRWHLDSERAEAAAAGKLREVDAERLRSWSSGTILAVGSSGEPVTRDSSSRVLLCQVPDDIIEVRRSDPALARSWRLALREAITKAMAARYAITGATRGGWYILEST